MTARTKSISAAATTITKSSLCLRGASDGASRPSIHAPCEGSHALCALSPGWRVTGSSSAGRQLTPQNRVEQAKLSLAGRVPAEFFGITARSRPRWKRAEQPLHPFCDAGRRTFAHQHSRLGPRNNFGVSPDVRSDDWRSASHRFQEDIRPALPARSQDQRVRGSVNLVQLLMRQGAQEAHAIRDFESVRQILQSTPLGTIAGDEKPEVRQQGQRTDDKFMAFAL